MAFEVPLQYFGKMDAPLKGQYANDFKVGHNAYDFVIDFGQFDLDSHAERFHTRIITAPAYAKMFSSLLVESVNRYESSFGEIENIHDPGEVSPEV